MLENPVRKLRVAYAKRGLLRMVAHRDMGTHLRRMFLRARLPLSWSQGFSPKPKFHFGPPLPLGATCGEDWLDLDVEEAVTGSEFLARVEPQTIHGLEWRRALLLEPGAPKLQDILQYGEWTLVPYEPEATKGMVETLLEKSNGESLVFSKRSKRGKLREVDARPKILSAEPEGAGVRVVLGASPTAPEGGLGLFDYLRAALPDLEEHPMVTFQVERRRFLRREGDQLLSAVDEGVGAEGSASLAASEGSGAGGGA